MNIVSQPHLSCSEVIVVNRKNGVNFTALNKVPKTNQAKDACSTFKYMYGLFFVPRKENVLHISDKCVYTQQVLEEGTKRVSKKYDLWSKKPQEIVDDNYVVRLRKHQIIREDGNYDVEMRDMHVPEHRVSVIYKDVQKSAEKSGKDEVKGSIKIIYGDKEVDISMDEAKQLRQEFSAAIDKRFDEATINTLLDSKRPYEERRAIIDDFYRDENVIGSRILESPSSLEKQIHTIPSSMPYGIEAIFAKMHK